MMTVLSIVVLLPIGALLGRGLMIGPADLWDMRQFAPDLGGADACRSARR